MARPVRSTLHLIAAALVAAAVTLVLPAGPAGAATCSSAHGVSVVVDFHQLGGGVQSACVADGGTARSLFERAGFALADVQRQPGFVCRVNGLPANDPCVNTPPADAYWGLFWSDGKTGRWTYATTAASGLNVPDGGYVAFSWNGSTSRSAPGLSPTAHAVAPKPTTKPAAKPSTKPSGKPAASSTKPTKKPTRGATSGSGASSGGSGSPSATPSDTASSTPSQSPSKQPSKQPSEQPSGTADEPATSPESDTPTPSSATSDPADPSDGGLPTWVGPVVVGVLFAAGGAVAVVRRRRNPTP